MSKAVYKNHLLLNKLDLISSIAYCYFTTAVFSFTKAYSFSHCVKRVRFFYGAYYLGNLLSEQTKNKSFM